MNQHKMDVIKEEFGDDLATPLEGWSFVTRNATTSSSSPLSPNTTSQTVSNQPSPPATSSNHQTSSNHTSTSTSRSSHVKQTYANVASVHLMPPYARQGLVKNVETNRPVIPACHNKFVQICSKSQQTNSTALLFNVELQLKQTQEQLKKVTAKLVDNQNAYEVLEKKYDELKLVHLELKTNANNANKSIEELKADNAKLHDKLDQLMLIVNAQTHETNRANANINIKQEYEDGETAIDDVASDHVKMELKEEFEEETNQQVDCNEPEIKGALDYGQEIEVKQEDEDKDQTTDSEEMGEIMEQEVEEEGETSQQISDTSNNELTDTRQVTQIVNTQFESPPNEDKLVDLFEVDEDEHCDTRGARKRELDCEGVDTERAVKRQTSELRNGEDGVIRANEGAEQSEVNEQTINAQEELIDQSPTQSTANAQQNQFITVHLKCPQLDCADTFTDDHQLNRHALEKHDIRLLRCLLKDCAQSFDSNTTLGQHIKAVHPDTTEWHCGKCARHYTTYHHLSIHNSQYHQLGLFHCSFPSCTVTGEYKMKMYDHYKQQHKAKPTLNCPYSNCNYQTTYSTNLKRHQHTYFATKPFRCKWPECDYASTRQYSTIKHIRCHFTSNSSPVPNGALVDPKDYLEVVREL